MHLFHQDAEDTCVQARTGVDATHVGLIWHAAAMAQLLSRLLCVNMRDYQNLRVEEIAMCLNTSVRFGVMFLFYVKHD